MHTRPKPNEATSRDEAILSPLSVSYCLSEAYRAESGNSWGCPLLSLFLPVLILLVLQAAVELSEMTFVSGDVSNIYAYLIDLLQAGRLANE